METEARADDYEFKNLDNEWIDQIEENRSRERVSAMSNIKKEQNIQKKTYDRKVKPNR